MVMHVHAGDQPRATFRLRGRQVQLETLGDQLDAVRAGRGGTVLVMGLAGMGKTALLDAADGMAREREVSVFRGTGDVAGQVIPLGPLLEALVSVPDAPVDPAVLRDLSQSPDQRFWLLRELQEALERAALRAPLLISVDDVQWADAATLAALGTLPRQLATHRILWLLAARSGDLAPAASTAVHRLEAGGALKITLDPLDRTAVAGVGQDLLGGVPDPALLKVLAGVRGQPFLLTELLRGLREERLVQVDGGIARLAGTRIPLRFVDSLASFVAAGAERDAARVRRLLRARGVRPAAGGPRSAPAWPELTESEFVVVSLVAQGATNREVAERLYLSPYTVNSHLRHVFAKLGIRSRVELAHLATARGMPDERS
jgi:DNA-binding CsgD family transcriptional regulator/predicted ATPase